MRVICSRFDVLLNLNVRVYSNNAISVKKKKKRGALIRAGVLIGMEYWALIGMRMLTR